MQPSEDGEGHEGDLLKMPMLSIIILLFFFSVLRPSHSSALPLSPFSLSSLSLPALLPSGLPHPPLAAPTKGVGVDFAGDVAARLQHLGGQVRHGAGAIQVDDSLGLVQHLGQAKISQLRCRSWGKCLWMSREAFVEM